MRELPPDEALEHEPDDEMIEIQNVDQIPDFATEAEEAAFWGTHSLAPRFYTRRGPKPGSSLERIQHDRARPKV
ncbi:MAG: hypothetical protein ACR2PL_04165 [Dehalococcoidia bacterium]